MRAKVARSFFDRAIGLIRYRKPPLFVMVFENCKMIHTFGMAYPIHVVFLDKRFRVVRKMYMNPYRVSPYVRGAQYCIESHYPIPIEKEDYMDLS